MLTKLTSAALFTFLLPLCLLSQTFVGPHKAIDPYHYSIVKHKTYLKGAVASAHPLASMVGAEILKRGGNAIDAMIATQLTLAVVYPGAGNIGGGGFLVARMKDGKTITLDYREAAPAAASRSMYLDTNGDVRPGLSTDGHLAAGVPGTVSGLFASAKYASLPFKMLIQPAIELAEKGFTLTAREATKYNNLQDDLKKFNTVVPVLLNSKGWKAGDTLIQKDLANTLKRIRDHGAAGFYEGETARLITAEMQRGKGIVTPDDLKSYKTKQREPLQFDYRGYTVVGMPPPSSGGVLLLQMLKMTEKYPLASYGFETVKSTHLMVEAERRAYADRAEYLGDPDFYKVPVKAITSNEYLVNRMADFDSSKASKSTDIKAGPAESTQTTHISIVDRWGNMASVTTTLNDNFGCKTVVGGAGFFLNDEMDDFSAKPGVPNMYGATGGEANSIEPGKRMLSSMTPTIVLKDNKPFMVVGTPGGTTIPTSIYQTIVDVIDFNMPLQDAVNKPKFHHQWLPDVIEVEKDFPADVRAELERMGHKIKAYNVEGYAITIGRVEAIKVTNGKAEAVADTRGDDTVAGY